MELYVLTKSPNCRKILAVVDHLDLNVDIKAKDGTPDELKAEEYLAINPNGMVPALVDGHFTLWESNAIMQYVAAKAPDNDLFPDDIQTRSDIVRWQFWEANHYNKAANAIIWETFAKPVFNLPGDPDEDIIQASLEQFHKFAPILETQLDDHDFITGNALTLADYSVGYLSTIVLMDSSRIPLEQYPNIKSWYERLEESTAWAKFKPAW